MSFIDNLVRSKGYKNFMAKLYGWGAAVVIIGALFKINHWPGAVPMLILGMGTEAIIFFLSAFEPPHVEWDWSLAFPELAGIGMPDETSKLTTGKGNQTMLSSDPLTQQLDKMLSDAKISPELIDRLGSGMQNLADSAQSMNNMASATAATDQFVSNMDGAAQAAGKLLDSMKGAPEAVSTLTNIYNETAEAMKGGDVNYAEEMKRMASKLATINNMYEMQIKNNASQVAASKEIEERIQAMMKNFADSAQGAMKYKEQVDALARKVSELNNVYGNMLAAMQTRI